jgi:hypothetical protein
MNWSECPDVESDPGVVSGAHVVKGARFPADAIALTTTISRRGWPIRAIVAITSHNLWAFEASHA